MGTWMRWGYRKGDGGGVGWRGPLQRCRLLTPLECRAPSEKETADGKEKKKRKKKEGTKTPSHLPRQSSSNLHILSRRRECATIGGRRVSPRCMLAGLASLAWFGLVWFGFVWLN